MSQKITMSLAIAAALSSALAAAAVSTPAQAGAKEKCSLCHGVILPLETVYEVNVKPQEGVEPQVLHFHLECHSAWTMACMEAPVDSTGSN